MSLKSALSVLLAVAVLSAVPQPVMGCYGVIVGRKASVDGSVLLGHNEQNGGTRLVNLRKIPRLTHAKGSAVELHNGGTLPQVPETYSFLWSQNVGLPFSDGYLNEWGVAIVSDGCGTREGSTEGIADGGIGYMLRRLVAERATTAREGVQVAAGLVERFGYWASGRTYVIADPQEAWLMSVVRGQRWVAQRVPDDGVVLLPNVHIIDQIDLADTESFMGSPDIVDHAIEMGWYDPDSGRSFSFRRAYNAGRGRDARQERGQFLVTGQRPGADVNPLPFAVQPEHPMTVADVISVLRDGDLTHAATQEGAVLQLRSWFPPAIGCVYWRTSAEPRAGILVPWYVGIDVTPPSYYKPVDVRVQLSLEYQFEPPPGTFTPDSATAWWVFRDFQDRFYEDMSRAMEVVRPVWDAFEAQAYARQAEVDAEALRLYNENPDAARDLLTEQTERQALGALELTQYMAQMLTTGGAAPAVALRPYVLAGPTELGITHTGLATRIEVSMGLEAPAAEMAAVDRIVVDLSSVGMPHPIPLELEDDGRYRAHATVTPTQNGRHRIPVLAHGTDGVDRWLFTTTLDVYPTADLAVFGDQLSEGWELTGRNVEHINEVETGSVYSGSAACSAWGKRHFSGWWLTFEASEPVHSLGYETLTFAVRFEDVEPPRNVRLTVGIRPGATVDLIQGQIDLESNEWQVVQIPVSGFGLVEPITSVELYGNFEGMVYVDEVRIVIGPTPATAVTIDNSQQLPRAAELLPNYPNPFNSETVIRFAQPTPERVELAVYNMVGQQVTSLVNGWREAGSYSLCWDGRDDGGEALASGVYLYRLQAGEQLETRKLVLVR